jgi:transcriptional regulator GlxA family with amidase domain
MLGTRGDRAKQFLQAAGDFPLAQFVARAGFSDQNMFSHHLKRIVGVSSGRFRTPARIA